MVFKVEVYIANITDIKSKVKWSSSYKFFNEFPTNDRMCEWKEDYGIQILVYWLVTERIKKKRAKR